GLSRGSNACASTRLRLSAASTAFPDSNEISRSVESPPNSTATRPNALGSVTCCRAVGSYFSRIDSFRSVLADDPDFRIQQHAVHALHRALHVRDQVFDIRCRRVAVVDDEIRVLLRDRGIAEAEAFEPGLFDE